MKVSVVVAVLNEEKSIRALLDSLLGQKLKADEIIIVDDFSTDSTAEIVSLYQQKIKNIILLREKSNRSQARNMGIQKSKNEIIAITDAGCIADKHWLERIVKPFKNSKVDIVYGFYEMIGEDPFRKALSVFLGVSPSNFDSNFVASARSLALRKTIWEKVGGFPENMKDTAEDMLFSYQLVKKGAKIVCVKDAIVYWKLPSSFISAIIKMHLYARGDAKSKIWWHPTKKFATHNIKIFFLFLRYLIAFFIFLGAFYLKPLQFVFALGFVLYIFWAFRKVYIQTSDVKASFCGILLQIFSDFAVMSGFLVGLMS